MAILKTRSDLLSLVGNLIEVGVSDRPGGISRCYVGFLEDLTAGADGLILLRVEEQLFENEEAEDAKYEYFQRLVVPIDDLEILDATRYVRYRGSPPW